MGRVQSSIILRGDLADQIAAAVRLIHSTPVQSRDEAIHRAGQMAAYRHIAENNGLFVPEAAPPSQAAGLVGRDG